MKLQFHKFLIRVDLYHLPLPRRAQRLYCVHPWTPKGIIQEHAQMYTSIKAHLTMMGLNQESRVYQFASYVFDVSVSDIFDAFMHGACVCILSESDRVDDLERSISRLNATHICLIPTVTRSLNPARLPNSKNLTLGREKLTNNLVKSWSSRVRLNNIYGVTECNVWCAMQPKVLPYSRHGILLSLIRSTCAYTTRLPMQTVMIPKMK